MIGLGEGGIIVGGEAVTFVTGGMFDSAGEYIDYAKVGPISKLSTSYRQAEVTHQSIERLLGLHVHGVRLRCRFCKDFEKGLTSISDLHKRLRHLLLESLMLAYTRRMRKRNGCLPSDFNIEPLVDLVFYTFSPSCLIQVVFTT